MHMKMSSSTCSYVAYCNPWSTETFFAHRITNPTITTFKTNNEFGTPNWPPTKLHRAVMPWQYYDFHSARLDKAALLYLSHSPSWTPSERSHICMNLVRILLYLILFLLPLFNHYWGFMPTLPFSQVSDAFVNPKPTAEKPCTWFPASTYSPLDHAWYKEQIARDPWNTSLAWKNWGIGEIQAGSSQWNRQAAI